MDRYIAIHEAAHAVVADALGLHVLGVEQGEYGFRVALSVPDDPTQTEALALAAVSRSRP